MYPLFDDSTLLTVIEPAIEGINLPRWLKSNGDKVDALVKKHGAILFRGFNVSSDDDFKEVNASLPWTSVEPNSWENTAPRKRIKEGVYVASTVPSTQSIFLHSDHTQSVYFAEKLVFFCSMPPTSGGENPFADNRAIYRNLDQDVLESFERKGWLLIRNFHESLGVSFNDAFWGRTKNEVIDYCREHDIDFQINMGVPRTVQVRRAIVEHPETNEKVWFNHIGFWHQATLPEEVKRLMVEAVGENALPFDVRYGDGTVIPDEVALHIREVMASQQKLFGWQQGDLVVADNILTCHGRMPYAGERKVRIGLFNQSRRAPFRA